MAGQGHLLSSTVGCRTTGYIPKPSLPDAGYEGGKRTFRCGPKIKELWDAIDSADGAIDTAPAMCGSCREPKVSLF
jgi:hypothetical protein